MKISVVGCGALGSFYGAKIAHTHPQTFFLLRSDYHAVRDHGVRIVSPDGDFVARPHPARIPEEIGPCDLVIVALKTTANEVLQQLLQPLVNEHTAVVTLQNGLGNEEQLAALFGHDKILGGLCFVCLNRVAPGTVRHIAFGTITLGEFQRSPLPRTHQIANLFSNAGIPCEVVPSLEQARWEKLVWNIPFNGLGVASCAGYEAVLSGNLPAHLKPGACRTTDQLLNDPEWHALVQEVMIEVIQAAQACGFSLPLSLADSMIERTRRMGAYRPSTLIDFEQGRPIELQSLFLEPLHRAQSARVHVPRLKALCSTLTQLQERQSVLGQHLSKPNA